jgi:hypothetical protein
VHRAISVLSDHREIQDSLVLTEPWVHRAQLALRACLAQLVT